MKLIHVTKSFEEKVILKDFSLDFPQGKITALMGASGGGKTTVLRLLMRLLEADSGQVEGYLGKAAAVFQEDRLSEPLSATQNVRLGKCGFSAGEARKILEDLGLSGHTEKPVSSLSGGMRRRVAIARALVKDADTVFLDEPFSALDTVTKQQVMTYVKNALRGKTVVFVTHDKEEAEFFADGIVNM